MTSLSQYFDTNNLIYSVSSSSQRSLQENKYNVFVDDSTIFCSNGDASDQWWQISFQYPVIVNSYIVKEINNHCGRPLSWIINVSHDNSNWKTIDSKNDVDSHNVVTPLKLEREVSCSRFRFILKKNACPNQILTISFFDVFGRLDSSSSSRIKGCTCKGRNTRNINIAFIFIFLCVY